MATTCDVSPGFTDRVCIPESAAAMVFMAYICPYCLAIFSLVDMLTVLFMPPVLLINETTDVVSMLRNSCMPGAAGVPAVILACCVTATLSNDNVSLDNGLSAFSDVTSVVGLRLAASLISRMSLVLFNDVLL